MYHINTTSQEKEVQEEDKQNEEEEGNIISKGTENISKGISETNEFMADSHELQEQDNCSKVHERNNLSVDTNIKNQPGLPLIVDLNKSTSALKIPTQKEMIHDSNFDSSSEKLTLPT